MTGVPAMTLSQLDVQWQQTPRTAVAESLSVPHSQQPHWPQCPETPPPLQTPTPPHHKSLLSLDPSLELVKYRLGSFYALHWYTDIYFCVHELEMSYEESYNIFKASLLFVSINWICPEGNQQCSIKSSELPFFFFYFMLNNNWELIHNLFHRCDPHT